MKRLQVFRNKPDLSFKFTFWLIVLFHAINNCIWLRDTTSINGTDVPNHLLFQLKFHHALNNLLSNPHLFILIKLKKILELMNMPMSSSDCIYWSNFVYLSSTVFSLFFGNFLFVVKITMLIYFVILLFSVYFIAKTILDRQTGIIAMFIVSIYPLIFESSRQYSLDFPLTAVVTLSVLLLLKTIYFTNTFFSVLLGISSGIGMLIKGQFILFFIWPLIVFLSRSFLIKSEKKDFKIIIFNVIIFFAIAAAIASIWWFNKLGSLGAGFIEHISSNKFLESGTVNKIYSLDFYLYHLRALISSSIGYIFSGIFIISLFHLIKYRFKYRVLIMTWILIPFATFSLLFVIKHDRFLMPILPAIAIVLALGIRQLKSKILKRSVLILIIFAGLIQYFVLSYFYGWYEDNAKIMNIPPIFHSRTCYAAKPYYDSEKLTLTREATDTITKDYGKRGKCKIGTIAFSGRICPNEILYWLYYWNNDFEVMDWLENYASFSKELPGLRYIIFISYIDDGFIWPKGDNFLKLVSRYTDLRRFESYPDWHENFKNLSAYESKFHLLKKIDFSNKIRWYIYKNKNIDD